ncbi:MAG TPA: hypothetical protein VKA90_09065, partial [Beijerinckiaceae bacterium]|nr:hypothetical protein [Beijerinckiaceae bacterium]
MSFGPRAQGRYSRAHNKGPTHDTLASINSHRNFGFAVGAGQALAQDKIYRSAEAVSGKEVRLSMHANVSKDCKPGPLPEIKVVTTA